MKYVLIQSKYYFFIHVNTSFIVDCFDFLLFSIYQITANFWLVSVKSVHWQWFQCNFSTSQTSGEVLYQCSCLQPAGAYLGYILVGVDFVFSSLYLNTISLDCSKEKIMWTMQTCIVVKNLNLINSLWFCSLLHLQKTLKLCLMSLLFNISSEPLNLCVSGVHSQCILEPDLWIILRISTWNFL